MGVEFQIHGNIVGIKQVLSKRLLEMSTSTQSDSVEGVFFADDVSFCSKVAN